LENDLLDGLELGDLPRFQNQQESSHSQPFDERRAIGHHQMWLDPGLTFWKDRFQSGQDLRARRSKFEEKG